MLPEPADQAALDALAADYADIYLTYKLRVSPCESVWLDEDGLIMQEPMFQIREWYERYGLAAQNWRERTDDHLVLQLQFRQPPARRPAKDAGSCARRRASSTSTCCAGSWTSPSGSPAAAGTPFYAGLAALTAMYVEELRDLLAELLGEPRPSAEDIEERMSLDQDEGEVPGYPHRERTGHTRLRGNLARTQARCWQRRIGSC